MDEQTFVTCVTAMTDALYRVSMGILHCREDAQDAVQQALLKAWQAREKMQHVAFSPYLMRIVINECRNLQRRRKRIFPSDLTEHLQEAEGPFDLSLRDALMHLPENERIALILKYMEGYSEKDIARTVRAPVSTVKARLRRGREKMRKQWKEEVF